MPRMKPTADGSKPTYTYQAPKNAPDWYRLIDARLREIQDRHLTKIPYQIRPTVGEWDALKRIAQETGMSHPDVVRWAFDVLIYYYDEFASQHESLAKDGQAPEHAKGERRV